jgi:hypothetical protein
MVSGLAYEADDSSLNGCQTDEQMFTARQPLTGALRRMCPFGAASTESDTLFSIYGSIVKETLFESILPFQAMPPLPGLV